MHVSRPKAAVLPLAALALCTAGGRAWGQSYAVTNANDDGPGSLRQAIVSANAARGPVTVTMADGLGTVLLQSPLPAITHAVTVRGGAGDAVSGAGRYRIFYVDAPGAAAAVTNLLLLDGKAQRGAGGGAGLDGGRGSQSSPASGDEPDEPSRSPFPRPPRNAVEVV